jgi:hypothetical protein
MQSERKEEGAEPRSSTKILWAPYTSRLSQVLPTYVFPQAANWQNKPEGPRRLLEKLITSWMNWSRIQLRYFGVRNASNFSTAIETLMYLGLKDVKLPTHAFFIFTEFCQQDTDSTVHRTPPRWCIAASASLPSRVPSGLSSRFHPGGYPAG